MPFISALFSRAQARVDDAIDTAVNRVIIAIPFLLSAGFATAAGAYWLIDQYGPIQGNAILAAGFLSLGVVSLAAIRLRLDDLREPLVSQEPEPAQHRTNDHDRSQMSNADLELAKSTLMAVAPTALPGLLRAASRNLPLILAIMAVVFFMFQRGGSDAGDEAGKDTSAAA